MYENQITTLEILGSNLTKVCSLLQLKGKSQRKSFPLSKLCFYQFTSQLMGIRPISEKYETVTVIHVSAI